MYKFVSCIPTKTIIYLIFIWIFLIALNVFLELFGFFNNTPTLFPIIVFNGPTINLSGVPYLIIFIIVLAFSIKLATKLTIIQVWLLGLTLIILGNLGQGSWDSAFIKPFTAGSMQYYHDAIRISSSSEWLHSFNSIQHTLLQHTKTHPPFAVLSHFLFLHISANSIIFLSMVFILISSLSLILIWQIFRTLSVSLENRNLLTILFSIIPAVNIYSAVSLDAIILTSATLFLFGIVLVFKLGSINIVGLLSIVLGITITNLLSFGGVFLLAVAGLLAFKEFLFSRKYNIAFALLISIVFFSTLASYLYLFYGYNHLEAFFTAAALENPHGFRGLHEPFKYIATRAACIGEIALFLSFGFLAILFHPNKLKISYSNWRVTEIGILLAGFITLIAMLLSGAFRTGEMARPALFIYPYIMLILSRAETMLLKDILKVAGIQTLAMQLLGEYFW